MILDHYRTYLTKNNSAVRLTFRMTSGRWRGEALSPDGYITSAVWNSDGSCRVGGTGLDIKPATHVIPYAIDDGGRS